MAIFNRQQSGESRPRIYSPHQDFSVHLIARSSQASSTAREETLQQGADIYRRIGDGDKAELERFKALALASRLGVRAIVVPIDENMQ